MRRIDEEPDPIPTEHPRRTPNLIGHASAVAALRRAWDGGRMPHAWLIGGVAGIGKATLAYRFARFVLAGGPDGTGIDLPDGHPVLTRVARAAHPDLRTIERAFDDKRQRRRGEIVVDQVRAEAGLFALTAGGGWRVLIVDEADLMNANAANALLKLLEEPPARSLLLLTAHRVGALLPTIRSRCRPLALAPLSAAEVAQAVAGRRPDHDAGARAVAVALADGSIGRALALLDGDGATLNRDLLACWAPDGQLLWERAWALADRAQRLDGDGFLMLERLLRGWLGRLARVAASGGQGIDPAERPRAEAIVRRYGLERILAMWENAGDLFQRADGLNLQRRQTVLAVFGALDPPTAPTKRPT